MKHWLAAIAVITLVLVPAHSVRAQDQDAITLIAAGIMQGPIERLIPGFEAKTGHKVKATFGGEDTTKQQIIKGEAFDVPVLESAGKTPWSVIASGNVVASSATPIAKIPVGVAVRKGAPKPDISTPEAVKRMLLAAKSIAYPDLPAPRPRGLASTTRSRSLASPSRCSRRPRRPGAAPAPWPWWPAARSKLA